MDTKQLIEEGNSVLGIEFGSTRIKAVLVDEKGNPIASGSKEWENDLKDGIWTDRKIKGKGKLDKQQIIGRL